MLWEQIARQKAKKVAKNGTEHEYLFTTRKGTPWDMDTNRSRKLHPLLKSLGISKAGYHTFRHFNTSLMDALRVPVKTIQERLGHSLTGCIHVGRLRGQPDWERNVEAAQLIGAEIERVVLISKAKPSQQIEPEVAVSSGYSGGLTSVNGNDLRDCAS
jgi:integrase